MSESELVDYDPLSKPSSQSPSVRPLHCLLPRWTRILVVAVLIASPILVFLWEDVSDRLVFSVVAWSGWSAIAFVAVQGPGQWRNIIGGILYGLVLAVIVLMLYSSYRPTDFVSWDTFWNIDFPFYVSDLIVSWCLLRMLSMLTGIEIIDPNTRPRPRWSLARWMFLMVVLAVLIQVSMLRMNFAAEMSAVHFDKSNVGPLPESPIVTSRRAWLDIQLAEMLFVPFVPILAAGWMLAGRPWRWLMFPFFAALTIAEYALAEVLFLEATKSLYSTAIDKEWALWGTFSWFAYGFAAILVPFMGFRWTDYWTRFPSSPVSKQPEFTIKV